jgi:hypothetical protein
MRAVAEVTAAAAAWLTLTKIVELISWGPNGQSPQSFNTVRSVFETGGCEAGTATGMRYHREERRRKRTQE